jgi:nitroreductase
MSGPHHRDGSEGEISHPHGGLQGFLLEDTALVLSLLDLYATTLGLGACWAGYVYKTVNAYPPLFEALGLPSGHLAFGAMMIGYPKFKYRRIPIRNRPKVIWR